MRGPGTAPCLILAASCLLVYELTSYGGVRSPDSEIVFRTSEALARRGSFAVEEGIGGFEDFGLAPGKDGRKYSIFGPGEALAAAPLVAIGRAAAARGVFARGDSPLPVSHFTDGGLLSFLQGRPSPHRNEDGIRWVASQLNVLVTTLTVLLFFFVAFRFCGDVTAALFAAVIYAFGTPAWAYSGTFFSEPLATLFSLASFYLLLVNDRRFGAIAPSMKKPPLAGACLGVACATHITALLFAPFFILYATYPWKRAKMLAPALGFAGGLAVVLALLGWFNLARFGSVWETGRTVIPNAAEIFGYGVRTNPWPGVYGLLVSSNKGLFLFAPVLVLTLIAWPRFHRAQPFLARMLAATVLVRIAFIASRSDWHGGYCLGPRYLVMLLPFVCLPVALIAKSALAGTRRAWYTLVAFGWLLVCQQYYFSLGEIFSYYHLLRERRMAAGSTFSEGRFYFEWSGSPLTTLLDGFRGPFLLRQLPADNYTLLWIGCLVLAVIAALAAVRSGAGRRRAA